jgi:hypothetical protein
MRFPFRRKKRAAGGTADQFDRLDDIGVGMHSIRDLLKIEPRQAAAALVATRQKTGNREVETDLLATVNGIGEMGAAMVDLANQSRPIIEAYIATADDIERVLADVPMGSTP